MKVRPSPIPGTLVYTHTHTHTHTHTLAHTHTPPHPSLTLRDSQNTEHSDAGVSLRGGVGHVVVVHRVVGPVAQPQVLADEGHVLDEVHEDDQRGEAPAHGPQVLQVDGELHLHTAESRRTETAQVRFTMRLDAGGWVTVCMSKIPHVQSSQSVE